MKVELKIKSSGMAEDTNIVIDGYERMVRVALEAIKDAVRKEGFGWEIK